MGVFYVLVTPPNTLALRSPVEIGDPNVLRDGSETAQVVGIARGDDGSSTQVGIGHEEGVDRHVRPGTDRSEKLTGAYADSTVDGMHLDPLTP